jgi:hypothetical protein
MCVPEQYGKAGISQRIPGSADEAHPQHRTDPVIICSYPGCSGVLPRPAGQDHIIADIAKIKSMPTTTSAISRYLGLACHAYRDAVNVPAICFAVT